MIICLFIEMTVIILAILLGLLLVVNILGGIYIIIKKYRKTPNAEKRK